MRDILEEYKPELTTLAIGINSGVSTETTLGLVKALIESAYAQGQTDPLSTSQE